MKTSTNIDELAVAFQGKVSQCRQKLDLRDMDVNDPPPMLAGLEADVSKLRVLLTVMRAENSRRRAALKKVQAYKADVETMQARIKHASSRLPTHLPHRVMPVPPPPPPAALARDPSSNSNNSNLRTPKQKRFLIPETPTTVSADTPSIEQIKRKSQTLFVPSLDFITIDEFEAVPKYMKGRLTYGAVNAAVEEVNKALDVKYSALAVPKSKRSEKGKVACRRYKEQENGDTKGVNFVTAADLKEHSKLRMDKASHVMLTILRHCGRIRELRSKGLLRYTTNQHSHANH